MLGDVCLCLPQISNFKLRQIPPFNHHTYRFPRCSSLSIVIRFQTFGHMSISTNTRFINAPSDVASSNRSSHQMSMRYRLTIRKYPKTARSYARICKLLMPGRIRAKRHSHVLEAQILNHLYSGTWKGFTSTKRFSARFTYSI